MFAKLLKSKTVNFNVWIPIIATIVATIGIEVPAEVWAGVLAIGNFLLRFFTDKALADK